MEKVRIGKIVNTHGLKGEVKIIPYTDFVEDRFSKGSEMFIENSGKMIDLKVKFYRPYKNQMILAVFEQYEDINLIEKYKGYNLYIDSRNRPQLNENEVYQSDLIKCEVYDEDGNLIGVVDEIMNTGANSVLRINHTILVPYVKAFIKSEDIKNKKIVIYNYEGLK